MTNTALPDEKQYPSRTHHPRFARVYEALTRGKQVRKREDPLREETAGQAHGIVLEVGAGTGLNFLFYKPDRVERVEAIELDTAMLTYARRRASETSVPITLTQAPVEALPFPDDTFDSAVTTLVFCSVTDPLQGFQEIRRVLKPGGDLFLFEHVRANGKINAGIQDFMVPVTTRLLGNCHWNRDTRHTLISASFHIVGERRIDGGIQPFIVVHARS